MKEQVSKRLKELINLKKAGNPSLSVPAQAEEMGIPYQTFNKYVQAKSECSAYYLAVIARYYNVSTDYLLGMTDTKSSSAPIRAVCKYTGLSEETVSKLHTWKCSQDMRQNWGKYVSFLLDNSNFENALENLSYLNGMKKLSAKLKKNGQSPDEDFVDGYIARLWFISKELETAVESFVTQYKGDK